MTRSIRSLSIGRRVAAVGVAAMALASAACSDATTAPSSPAREVPAANALTVGIGGVPQVATFISVRIIDVAGANVTEKATVKFRWFQPTDSLVVQDNSAKDVDPTIGVVKIAAPKANGYQGCVIGETRHFAADPTGASYPTCNSKWWLSFDFSLGNVYMRRKPQLTVKMIDEWSHLLPGATLRVYAGAYSVDVADGSLADEPTLNDGKITVTVPRAGKYVWGEVKLPSGKYELIDSQWYSGDLGWETKTNALLLFREVAF